MVARSRNPAGIVAALLIVTFLGSPLARVISSGCDQCPADCPMHAKASRPKCHEGHAGLKPDRSVGHCRATPGIARPGCGRGHELADFTTVRAVLPVAAVSSRLEVGVPIAVTARRIRTRGAEPPEPPPPIVPA